MVHQPLMFDNRVARRRFIVKLCTFGTEISELYHFLHSKVSCRSACPSGNRSPLLFTAHSMQTLMKAFKKRIAPVSASAVHGIGGKDVPPAAHLSGLTALPGARPPERKSVLELLSASQYSFSVVQHAEAFCSQLVRFRPATRLSPTAHIECADSRATPGLAIGIETRPCPCPRAPSFSLSRACWLPALKRASKPVR